MRKRIFSIIEVAHSGDVASAIYDTIMFLAIIISIIPLAFKQEHEIFLITDVVTTTLFIIDYILRFFTCDLKLKKGAKSFAIYPFTPWAIIDLVSILPSITLLNSAFKLLRLFRLARFMRIFRIFKAMRYSKSFYRILKVIKKSKDSLIAVGVLAVVYILISALVIFNAEPDSFHTFFDAVYWATVSLTTVGYGDIYPVTNIGRVITMISAIMGIAIVALPAGVLTAGYMAVLEEEKKDKDEARGEKTTKKEAEERAAKISCMPTQAMEEGSDGIDRGTNNGYGKTAPPVLTKEEAAEVVANKK